MARKIHFAGFSALAAATIVAFSSAEFSDAYAQQGDAIESEGESGHGHGPAPADGAALPVTEETLPVFVSQEVVQPLPDAVQSDRLAPPVRASSLHALVAQTDIPAELSREMRCLAGTVYFEARGEPLSGQLAVAQVVINRSASARFPSSYCGVVYQRAQFSFVRGGAMPQIPQTSHAWKKAQAIARIAHEGLWESEAHDSLYFHAKYVSPRWSRKLTRRASIKTHIFYR